MSASAQSIEDTIQALLYERQGKSICPSEVARSLSPKRWRPLMQPVREVVARMAGEGRVVATQKGKEVDALSARGPIRIKTAGSITRL